MRTCADINLGPCCDSCHDDADAFGFDLIKHFYFGENDPVSVCCRVARSLDQVTACRESPGPCFCGHHPGSVLFEATPPPHLESQDREGE